jgi:hypothetical protein
VAVEGWEVAKDRSALPVLSVSGVSCSAKGARQTLTIAFYDGRQHERLELFPEVPKVIRAYWTRRRHVRAAPTWGSSRERV